MTGAATTFRPPRGAPEGVVAHGRYRLERMVGEGGMATVYHATDLACGRAVALKRLRHQTAARRELLVSLFEREYLTLAQLAHPRIVEVYDYGVDEHGPFYTMELLDGGDLTSSAPAAFPRACALARDVCSALSLVHSRRMVYRDLSPHNVRCTSGGLAKLIDFGALTPFGLGANVVGTLPCMAPEVLRGQPLDQKTDLYALGATLYFTLTRRHAFPGRTLQELAALWSRGFEPASQWVHGIPSALDALVTDLLQADPERRPASAGEVIERLTAIADLPTQEELHVAQAYLARPTLVARETELAVVRGHVQHAKHGHGGSLLLEGPSGSGRTRMLETTRLEAKLGGMLVVDVTAGGGEYGAVRSLLRQLLAQAPTLARGLAEPYLARLAHWLPELSERREEESSDPLTDGSDEARSAHTAACSWVRAISASKPLLVTVDDVERLDAASAAFVAVLAHEAREHALLVVACRTPDVAVTGALHAALQLLARDSTGLALAPLDVESCENLLRSVFGDVPNVAHAARHVHRITNGNPRDVMQLAQHLVSEGTARYESCGWSLPRGLSPKDLPLSMADALSKRVQKLPSAAQSLGYALACEPKWGFSPEECAALVGPAEEVRVARALDALQHSDFARQVAQEVRATQLALSAPLADALTSARRAQLHACLAELALARADAVRATRHLFRAGEHERGVTLLVADSIASMQITEARPRALNELVFAMPNGWLEIYEEALATCQRLKRPARDAHAILSRMVGVLPLAGKEINGFVHTRRLLASLQHDAGLDLAAALAPELDPVARMNTALAQAAARHEALPEAERVLNPRAAIREVAKFTVSVLGNITTTSNYGELAYLPSLAALAPLSSAFVFIDHLVQVVRHRLGGRYDVALVGYHALLERITASQQVDTARDLHVSMRMMGAIGTIEAIMGRASSLDWAERVEREPMYESLANVIRQLYSLYQGNLREAKRLKQRVEMMLLSSVRDSSEAHQLFAELAGHALAHDLTGVGQALDAITPYGALSPACLAAAHYGRGEHHRIRGDYAAALRELTRALALMRPGEHLLWAACAAAHVRALTALERSAEACTFGESYLQAAGELGFGQNHIQVALSRALGQAGHFDRAAALADDAISRLQTYGSTGLNLAAAYEARAQIAAGCGDHAAFSRYRNLHAQHAPQGTDALRAAPESATGAAYGLEREGEGLAAASELRSIVESCKTPPERTERALALLARSVGAEEGVLFTRHDEGLIRTAVFGALGDDRAVDEWALDYFKREVTQYITQDESLPAEGRRSQPAAAAEAPRFHPVLLGHTDAEGHALTGLAVFVKTSGRPQPHPTRVAAELSRCLVEFGHVVATYLD